MRYIKQFFTRIKRKMKTLDKVRATPYNIRVGTVVKIAPDSGHYTDGDVDNPKDTLGRVSFHDPSRESNYKIRVEWVTGGNNNYRYQDLLVEDGVSIDLSTFPLLKFAGWRVYRCGEYLSFGCGQVKITRKEVESLIEFLEENGAAAAAQEELATALRVSLDTLLGVKPELYKAVFGTTLSSSSGDNIVHKIASKTGGYYPVDHILKTDPVHLRRLLLIP